MKEIATLGTTQLLKSEKKANNEIANTYATTSFVELKVEDLERQNSTTTGDISLMSVGNIEGSGYGEGSLSVIGYNTMYYEVIKVDATRYKKRLLSTNGGYRIIQPGIYIKYPSVYGNMMGYKEFGVIHTSIPFKPFYPTSDVFNHPFPNNGYVYEIPDAGFNATLGVTLLCQVYRGSGSPWSFEWTHNFPE